MTEIETRFEHVIDLLPTGHSVIIKLQKQKNGNVSISTGRVSPKGSYKPYFDTILPVKAYVEQNLRHILEPLYDKFKEQYPRRRTLFFRYNKKTGVLETFTTSGMMLKSKIQLLTPRTLAIENACN